MISLSNSIMSFVQLRPTQFLSQRGYLPQKSSNYVRLDFFLVELHNNMLWLNLAGDQRVVSLRDVSDAVFSSYYCMITMLR